MILLANFIVMVLPLLLIAAGIILVSKSRSSGRANVTFYTGVLLLSLPFGVLVYIGSGMIAAILRGEGHFYSVPFGGYTASNDAALLISAMVWIGMVFVCLAAILRPRK